MSTGLRVLSTVTAVLVVTCSMCALFVTSFQIPKPGSTDQPTVMVPVPFDRLDEILWTGDADTADTTCGKFKAYRCDAVEKIAGRWYTVYVSNIPKQTDYCSHFTNVQESCRCIGIDFMINLKDGVVTFDLFSTNIVEKSVTYEIAMAQMNGKVQLNLYQIILRKFVMQSNARIKGKGGFVIPNGVLVDTDEFNTYMIILFCLENAKKPIIMVLANHVPPLSNITNVKIENYLSNSGLDTEFIEVNHGNCGYGQNLVGYTSN